MYRELLAVCLLLAITADLLETKNTHHKRSDHWSVKSLLPHHKRQSTECNEDQFLCVNQSRCIPQRWICDTDNDCGDRSDEPDDCLTRECPAGHVKCPTGQCLEISGYCSRNLQCYNGQTALESVECPPAECDTDQFSCRQFTRCIPKSYVCDTDNDCFDSSDEENCSERVCGDDEIRCNNGQCVKLTSYCGENWGGCRDSTDMSTACLDYTCADGFFKCRSNGRCIYNSSRCDGYENCADGSDEQNCPEVECDEDFARCPGRNKCIRKRYFCDTDNDCGDNSDEAPALCGDRLCEASEVRCANGQCLDADGFCRGEFSCRDSSLTRDHAPACRKHEYENVVPDEPVQTMGVGDALGRCGGHVEATCGAPTIAQQFAGNTDNDVMSKLAEMEMTELCSSLVAWRDCALPAFEGNDLCRVAERLDLTMRSNVELGVRVLDFACVQHIEVINRAKPCLMKADEQGRPVLMSMIMMSCMQHLQVPGGFRPPACISPELQQCAKNVIATECNSDSLDIATVADELATMVQEQLCAPQPVLLPAAAKMKKRHAKEIELIKKMLRSIV